MIGKAKVEIKANYHGSNGVDYIVEYFDTDSFSELPQEKIKQCYGVCFCENKLVIGFGGMKKGWGLIGGSVEEGETPEETLHREIKEESNMEILSFKPVGYQKVIDTRDGSHFFQLRYVCKVRPFGEFVVDQGDGMSEKGITEIKLIDPKDYKQYFDWGEIGERIIQRALGLKAKLTQ